MNDERNRSHSSTDPLFSDSEAKGVRDRHEEEFAADFTAAPGLMDRRNLQLPENDRPHDNADARSEEESPSRTLGWAALAISIISLFVLPVFLGISAIVLGVIAYMRGTKALGAWSVVIGGIAILSYMVLIPRTY